MTQQSLRLCFHPCQWKHSPSNRLRNIFLFAMTQKSEPVLRDGEGQGSLACCSPWGCKELDAINWLYNNNKWNLLKTLLFQSTNKQKMKVMYWFLLHVNHGATDMSYRTASWERFTSKFWQPVYQISPAPVTASLMAHGSSLYGQNES